MLHKHDQISSQLDADAVMVSKSQDAPEPSMLCRMIYRWPCALAMRCNTTSTLQPLETKHNMWMNQADDQHEQIIPPVAYLSSVGDDLCNMLAALMIICLAVKLGDVPVTASTPASERVVMANECNNCLFEPKPYSSKLKPRLEIRSSCQICRWVFLFGNL